jgi:hypothetical protein
MLLITTSVELRVVAGRSRMRAGRPQAVSRWPCRDLEKNGMVGAWHGRGMASVNQTRPRCVNQMGKIHFKPLAAGERHGRGMLCVNQPLYIQRRPCLFFTQCDHCLCGLYLNTMSLSKQTITLLTIGQYDIGECKNNHPIHQ